MGAAMMYHQQGESPGLHSATPIRNGIGIKFGWKHTFISSATVQECTQRGVQRMVVIRGVENTVNKKKFKCSVHIVLEKVGRRQQSLKKAFPCIIDIIKKRSSIVLMLADLIWPKTNTDYVSGITRVLPAHSNKASISFCRHYWGSSTDQSNLEGKFYISGVTSEAEDHTAPRHPSLPPMHSQDWAQNTARRCWKACSPFHLSANSIQSSSVLASKGRHTGNYKQQSV